MWRVGVQHLRGPSVTVRTQRCTYRVSSQQCKSDITEEQDRAQALQRLRESSTEPLYPVHNLSEASTTVGTFRSQYEYLQNDQVLLDQEVELCGRIQTRRVHSTVLFFSIKQNQSSVQVKVLASDCKDFEFIKHNIRRTDIISVKGHPSRTARGELTLTAKEIKLLAPCYHQLPEWNNLSDSNIRYRQRYVDMLVNKDTNATFLLRSKVISYLRNFLVQRDFVEVETPILSTSAGGAMATPFVTTAIALHSTLQLRIAPELYLKQLVIGGLDRVFEIGKCFRNEGIDTTHNPEFTSCEFYEAYADYNTLMDITEELLRGMIFTILGTYKVAVPLKSDRTQTVVVDFEQPFQRISIVDELEKKGINYSEIVEAYKNKGMNGLTEHLKGICVAHGIPVTNPDNGKELASAPQLFDELVGAFVETQCIHPTFLVDHPIITSPLAKEHRSKPGIVERFELFLGGMEICNAYTELNDPEEQRKRFDMQTESMKALEFEEHNNGADAETFCWFRWFMPLSFCSFAESTDRMQGFVKSAETLKNEAEYVRALEYGLPPTGGWGIGIDRLVMLLSGKTAIKDVIPFPILKPEHQENE